MEDLANPQPLSHTPSHIGRRCIQIHTPSHKGRRCRKIHTPSHTGRRCRQIHTPSHTQEEDANKYTTIQSCFFAICQNYDLPNYIF